MSKAWTHLDRVLYCTIDLSYFVWEESCRPATHTDFISIYRFFTLRIRQKTDFLPCTNFFPKILIFLVIDTDFVLDQSGRSESVPANKKIFIVLCNQCEVRNKVFGMTNLSHMNIHDCMGISDWELNCCCERRIMVESVIHIYARRPWPWFSSFVCSSWGCLGLSWGRTFFVHRI